LEYPYSELLLYKLLRLLKPIPVYSETDATSVV